MSDHISELISRHAKAKTEKKLQSEADAIEIGCRNQWAAIGIWFNDWMAGNETTIRANKGKANRDFLARLSKLNEATIEWLGPSSVEAAKEFQASQYEEPRDVDSAAAVGWMVDFLVRLDASNSKVRLVSSEVKKFSLMEPASRTAFSRCLPFTLALIRHGANAKRCKRCDSILPVTRFDQDLCECCPDYNGLINCEAVSYTHLTLPTIYSV